MEAVPIYAAREGGGGAATNLARNLTVLSPTLRDEAIVSVGDRFALGAAVAKSLVAEGRTGNASVKCAVAQSAHTDARRIEVIEEIEVDVLVAGAGTSGALAAITAGREGTRTCALEFMGFPGGIGTGAGITCYFHGAKGGLQSEIDRRTLELNLLLEGRELPDRRWHHVGKILSLFDSFADARVRFVGRALLAEVRLDGAGRVTDVIAATCEGPVRIVAKSFVDCTGDGDLCAAAGAAFSLGRAGDGRMMAYSQSVFALRSDPEGLAVVSRNFDAGWTDPTDSEELSRARIEGVAQHARPTWEASETPLAVAPLPGVRQSRQIATDYALGLRDLVAHTSFADAVGEAESIADTHSVDLEFEDDEAFFFFCVCRLFRYSLRTQLPYRMLLPRGLTNVWIACRAAGLEPTASYAVRMQRDMQRLGEVAGRVAAGCAREDRVAREALPEWWKNEGQAVDHREVPAEREEPARWLESVAAGQAGLPLWRLFVRTGENRAALREIACGREAHPHASFCAAAVLAMWGDPAGEERLLAAIDAREEGPPPSENNTGAHGQEIDLPFWLLAIVLLRRGGTAACLPVLRRVADTPGLLFNVRTAVAITLERLASIGRISAEAAAEIAELLTRPPLSEVMLAPSHSIWRSLRGEPQLKLRNDAGADTRQDHAWQLHLVVARIRALAGLPETPEAAAYRADPRPWIRRIFEGVSKK
jgi:Dehydrogenases (flavoproteins)